jgi:phage terminase small subunit
VGAKVNRMSIDTIPERNVSQALTPQQQLFVAEYLHDLHGRRAAMRAGYAEPSAHVAASRLLSRPEIRKAIQDAIEARFSITKLSILEELSAIAFHDAGDYFSWTEHGVTVRPSDQLTPWQTKAIASVRQTNGRRGPRIEVQLVDKLKALELLARILGLFDPATKAPPTGNVQFIIETLPTSNTK